MENKEEMGKNFQPVESRASLGSVNDFSDQNIRQFEHLRALEFGFCTCDLANRSFG
jgi:hypothetical protein